jgi:signal transduction histidine kinase
MFNQREIKDNYKFIYFLGVCLLPIAVLLNGNIALGHIFIVISIALFFFDPVLKSLKTIYFLKIQFYLILSIGYLFWLVGFINYNQEFLTTLFKVWLFISFVIIIFSGKAFNRVRYLKWYRDK